MGEDVIIRERRPEDDARVVEIRNRNLPHLPALTIEEFRAEEEQSVHMEMAQFERFVAELDGQVAGSLVMTSTLSTPPTTSTTGACSISTFDWGMNRSRRESK